MTKLPAAPKVSDFMTPLPATVNSGLSLADALDRMYSDNIRHLPVVDDDGKLVGLVSTRDIALSASLRGVDPSRATVAGAMSSDPFACSADTALPEVAREMETRRLGSTLVTQDGAPVGIFTTTDAMRALRSFMAGEMVEPEVKPTHLVDQEPQEGRKEPHQRVRVQRPSRNSGMVSWFLAEL